MIHQRNQPKLAFYFNNSLKVFPMESGNGLSSDIVSTSPCNKNTELERIWCNLRYDIRFSMVVIGSPHSTLYS